jgi:hypothetical protein
MTEYQISSDAGIVECGGLEMPNGEKDEITPLLLLCCTANPFIALLVRGNEEILVDNCADVELPKVEDGGVEEKKRGGGDVM